MTLVALLLLVVLLAASSDALAAAGPKVLVLGGTGFVGSRITSEALRCGFSVTTISRRGSEGASSLVDARKGDATDVECLNAVLREGGYVAVFHAIGMLLESDLNRLASGSGSLPSKGSTYDQITRQTAYNAVDALTACTKAGQAAIPFIFISAAEAAWTFDGAFEGTPLAWLHRYLLAKRAVEDRLLSAAAASVLRPVIFRPSLIWTKERPGALLPVAAFTLGNALKLPFVDRPVNVDALAAAAVQAVRDTSARGVYDYEGVDSLAAAAASQKH